MTTAYFAKKALDIKFDIIAIKNMLIEAVIQQNENNPFEQTKQFVDCILTDLSTNPKNTFEELVFKWGFTNVLKELKSLDEKGYIKREGKHYSVRRKICGNLIPVYVLVLPERLRSNKVKSNNMED